MYEVTCLRVVLGACARAARRRHVRSEGSGRAVAWRLEHERQVNKGNKTTIQRPSGKQDFLSLACEPGCWLAASKHGGWAAHQLVLVPVACAASHGDAA